MVLSAVCHLTRSPLTTLYQGRCITTVRNTVHQGINVSILVQIQQIILSAENHQANQSHCLNTQSHDACISSVEQGFDAIYQTVYSNHLVSFLWAYHAPVLPI